MQCTLQCTSIETACQCSSSVHWNLQYILELHCMLLIHSKCLQCSSSAFCSFQEVSFQVDCMHFKSTGLYLPSTWQPGVRKNVKLIHYIIAYTLALLLFTLLWYKNPEKCLFGFKIHLIKFINWISSNIGCESL